MKEQTTDDDALVLERDQGRARPRWRDRRLIALLGAGAIVAVLIQVLDPSTPAEVATAASDETTFSSSTTAADRTTTSGEPLHPTTTTSSVGSEEGTAPSTTLAPVRHVPTTEPAAPALQPPPTIAPTTTTVDPHPWIGDQIADFWQASWWTDEEARVAFVVEGIWDHILVDFGDGETWVLQGSGYCVDSWGSLAATHTYAVEGEYTATISMLGSKDCDTPPTQYRTSTATTSVTFPLPQT